MRTTIIRTLQALALGAALTACAVTQPGQQTIAELASANPDFETLVAALDAAGLVPTFADAEAGPFTVFAPTDAAFADLLDALEIEAGDLLANVPLLTSVLTYHVLGSEIWAGDVIAAIGAGGGTATVETLNGATIDLTLSGGSVMINGSAKVVATNIDASNGVIHVIDSVLVPPTIAEVAVADGRFTTLVAALGAADLVGLFADPLSGPFTVFAPTDDAFGLLPEGTVEALLGDIPALTGILTYHVVSGKVMAADVLAAITAGAGTANVTTLNGADLSLTFDGTNVIINGTVKVIITDVDALNGVIHVIDAVLLPPS